MRGRRPETSLRPKRAGTAAHRHGGASCPTDTHQRVSRRKEARSATSPPPKAETMKYLKNITRRAVLRTLLAGVMTLMAFPTNVLAQDASFSQSYQAPLYLSPSFTGLTNGTRFAFNYRNQWPGIGSAYQDYAFSADYFFNRFNSGLGLMWVCDNAGKGILMDHLISLLYAYEFAITKEIFVRPGISFDFKNRSVDRNKLITWTDISSDGTITPGGFGSSLDIERTRVSRFDASASVMVYTDDWWGGVTFNHMLQPDMSFTDSKDKIGLKTTIFGGYRITYEDSYRGTEPKTITISANYKHQYQFNQLELGASWYYYPIEVGVSYRGLFFKVAGEVSNTDAVIPNLGVNIGPLRLGYSYDLTISDFSSFGDGAHEASLIYRLIPDDVKRRSYKKKPVPCSEPIMGYSYSGSGQRKARARRGLRR